MVRRLGTSIVLEACEIPAVPLWPGYMGHAVWFIRVLLSDGVSERHSVFPMLMQGGWDPLAACTVPRQHHRKSRAKPTTDLRRIWFDCQARKCHDTQLPTPVPNTLLFLPGIERKGPILKTFVT